MKKLITSLIIAFISISSLSAFTLDIEIPLKVEIAKTENYINRPYNQTHFLNIPIPVCGPVRAAYVFSPENMPKVNFGLGGSIYFYPFQAINISGSASYRLGKFKNGGTIELQNILDLGLCMHIKQYYNTEAGARTTKASFSPLIEESFLIVYRSNAEFPWYIGAGPVISGACLDGILRIYYGLNLNIGVRLNFDKLIQK